jgi:trk system potassium uptake protein TrkH
VGNFFNDLSAPQLFVGGFALLCLLGTLALRLLPGLYTSERLGWVDCLFMSVSAVCVTGLTVADVEHAFTFWGQLVLLVLIQLGGLGILAFASLIIVALGRRVSLAATEASSSELVNLPTMSARRLVGGIFLYTFVIEAITAGLLWSAFRRELGNVEAIWPAIFHAVSGFCQAGFSVFETSMEGWADSPTVLLTLSVAITFGGLGFLTLEDLRRRMRHRRHKLALHTKVVVTFMLALLAVGFGVYLWFEWDGVLGGMPLWEKCLNALFMSVTARSTGFNTVDYGQAGSGTNFVTVILMFIGGAPGGTAGGIKVTTFAVVLFLAYSRLRGRPQVSLFRRTIPRETIDKATGLIVATVAVITVALLILTRTEIRGDTDLRFLPLLFEVVSAYNTVGLSMGVTRDLSPTGELVLTIGMFLGRVGPITFAAVFARSLRKHDKFRYAHGDVVIG